MTARFESSKRLFLSLFGLCILTGLPFPIQEIHEKARAINVEVPVRVFDGRTFVAGLVGSDFELLEDGVPQDILACYSVDASRRENLPESGVENPVVPLPKKARTFILIFELNSFGKRCGDALRYVVENALGLEDTFIVATPLRTYRVGPESPARQNPAVLAKSLREKIADDIQEASSELRFLISDYLSIAEKEDDEIVVGRLNTLFELLGRIRRLKTVDEARLAQMAQSFARIEGQKHVLLFLEKEDVLFKRVLNSNMDQAALELFKMELMRDVQFDIERMSRLFAQNQLDFHFLFMTRSDELEMSIESPTTRWGEFEKQEITGEFFSVFRKISQATGGLTISSSNILASTKTVVEVAEKYYLLYYQPKNGIMDGRFREIKVLVRGKNYSILNRKGYLATEKDPSKLENRYLE